MSSDRDAKLNQLVSFLHTIPSSIFDPFDIYRTSYQSCGIDIGADILVPKKPSRISRRPVIVRIHGGFLVCVPSPNSRIDFLIFLQVAGSSLFPAWFSHWILEFAQEQSAIIVSPNYRLLPEVKGNEIVQDMKNFWDWFNKEGPQQSLNSVGRPEIQLDPEQLLLIGESAGESTMLFLAFANKNL